MIDAPHFPQAAPLPAKGNLPPPQPPMPPAPVVASAPPTGHSEPLPLAVQWWEGMLLSPQHLQQEDHYWAEQLRYRLAQLTPCFWGLGDLEIDASALADGVVSVQRLECVMPDGTPVIYPGHYVQPLVLKVPPSLLMGGPPLRVSLLMPRRQAGSVTAVAAGLTRNEVVPGQPVADQNAGGGALADAVPVDRLRPRVELFAGATVGQHYSACPLFELVFRPETQRIEFTPYHPPMLRWQAADFLGPLSLRRRIRTINEALWLKLRELGGDRRDDGPEGELPPSGLGAQQLEMARRLAAVLPRLGLLAGRPTATPLAVYDGLAEVVGAMASFGVNPIAPMLDAYRHDDCEPAFRRALSYIERKLGYVDTRHELLVFERVAHGRFERELPTTIAAELTIELRSPAGAVPSESERQALHHWLVHACVASQSMLEPAQRARVTARVSPLTPAEVASRRLREGAAYFTVSNEKIDTAGGGAQALVQGGQRMVIEGLPDAIEPALVLLVLPRGPKPEAVRD